MRSESGQFPYISRLLRVLLFQSGHNEQAFTLSEKQHNLFFVIKFHEPIF